MSSSNSVVVPFEQLKERMDIRDNAKAISKAVQTVCIKCQNCISEWENKYCWVIDYSDELEWPFIDHVSWWELYYYYNESSWEYGEYKKWELAWKYVLCREKNDWECQDFKEIEEKEDEVESKLLWWTLMIFWWIIIISHWVIDKIRNRKKKS